MLVKYFLLFLFDSGMAQMVNLTLRCSVVFYIFSQQHRDDTHDRQKGITAAPTRAKERNNKFVFSPLWGFVTTKLWHSVREYSYSPREN